VQRSSEHQKDEIQAQHMNSNKQNTYRIFNSNKRYIYIYLSDELIREAVETSLKRAPQIAGGVDAQGGTSPHVIRHVLCLESLNLRTFSQPWTGAYEFP